MSNPTSNVVQPAPLPPANPLATVPVHPGAISAAPPPVAHNTTAQAPLQASTGTTVQPPTFLPPLSSQTQHAVSTRGTPASLNLDDIFGDCFFTPDGDAVFLSDTQQGQQQQNTGQSNASSMIDVNGQSMVRSNETMVTNVASRPTTNMTNTTTRTTATTAQPQQYQPQQQTQQTQQFQTQQQQQQKYVQVPFGGGIGTTGLNQINARATVMGPPPTSTINGANATTVTPELVPMATPIRHHMHYAVGTGPTTTAATSTMTMMNKGVGGVVAGKKRAGGPGGSVMGNITTTGSAAAAVVTTGRERKPPEQGKKERRERNREHAKRSRIRKKFLLESLQQSVSLLKEENGKLRNSIRQHLGDTQADELLKKENLADVAANAKAGISSGGGSINGEGNSNEKNDNDLIASNSKEANKVLDDPDFSFIKALQTAEQNFVVTDPSLPDNPIVYATHGFLNLTGYTLDQVLGRNCRFLQGPETDPKAVEKIRRSIEEGSDMSVCLLNYRVDGTTFWNQFFIAALRDAAGNITNYVGVQCKVSDQYAANVCKKQDEEDARVADGEHGAEATEGDTMDINMENNVDVSAAAPTTATQGSLTATSIAATNPNSSEEVGSS